ncbi:cation transporter [Pseudoxanthomonas sp. F37]|uniref:heavy-metal-associated domain-containing protein n=1 Tax=Pseudoxanthomonas TaxID=83618 RepID=UPI001FD12514|nr:MULTISPECIES: cation transporter [Pseudoxanthomonas]UOV05528.1 cation transporter [Pseudoxanthomonas mexicana]UOV07085.1 cation transporter [Pseudoxanthomonas sp. F37]
MNLVVEGMTCGHCVQTVTRAIQALDPDAQVQVDLGSGVVSIEGALAVEQAVEAIQGQGYVVAAVLPQASDAPPTPAASCCGGCHR